MITIIIIVHLMICQMPRVSFISICIPTGVDIIHKSTVIYAFNKDDFFKDSNAFYFQSW